MRRGEVRLVDLAPSQGSEADKVRPAVLVSNDGANTAATRLHRGVVTVVPVTSNIARIHPFQILLDANGNGLSTDSKAQAEQVRSIDVSRVGRKLGTLSPSTMRELDNALRLHLGLG